MSSVDRGSTLPLTSVVPSGRTHSIRSTWVVRFSTRTPGSRCSRFRASVQMTTTTTPANVSTATSKPMRRGRSHPRVRFGARCASNLGRHARPVYPMNGACPANARSSLDRRRSSHRHRRAAARRVTSGHIVSELPNFPFWQRRITPLHSTSDPQERVVPLTFWNSLRDFRTLLPATLPYLQPSQDFVGDGRQRHLRRGSVLEPLIIRAWAE